MSKKIAIISLIIVIAITITILIMTLIYFINLQLFEYGISIKIAYLKA